ncbi:meiosis-specific topoisomerase spo11 [Stemphylium lycopersici]|nr:meiosis-specific topoisomerase spo11 [Stemphylium lycopersici]
MDPSDFEDLLFGDLDRQIGPQHTLFDESDDDILFPEYDESFLSWELANATSLTPISARTPPEQQPQANETYGHGQPHDGLTAPSHRPVRDRHWVIARIEAMLERIVDGLLEGHESLTITLKSRSTLSRRRITAAEGDGPIPPPKERDINFPGANAQEAWSFNLFVKQSVVDRYVDDLASWLTLGNQTAAAKGLVAGNFRLKQDNDHVFDGMGNKEVITSAFEIACVPNSRQGLLVPIVGDHDTWDLTEATFRSIMGSQQWDALGSHGVLLTAKGYPDLASRKFLCQLGDAAPQIPMFVLVDADPDGIAILSTYKYGSYRLAHEDVTPTDTPALRLPNIRWLGVKSHHMSRTPVGEDGIASDVMPQLQGLMRLTARDRIKAARMLEWNLCTEDGVEQGWRQELQKMLMLNVKAEMQILDELPGGSEAKSTMLGSAAISNDPRVPFQAPSPSGPQSYAPPPPECEHHGPGPAESSAIPQPLTPATTTRQSVPLGVFSTLLGNNTTSTLSARPILSDDNVPAILIHAQPADAQEGPSDLTASSGSVPSATTTLTNTLPPTQSAALRALNAPAFHSSPSKTKSAKSTSSRTTITSQPVVVRTYSASRHTSRPGSGFNTPRSFPMNGNTHASALSAGLAGRSEQLPSADDFSFSAILRAVDPEIRDAIDAIAEICAKSRMSLADEYDSHLPPQGEITGSGPGWAASTGALAGRGRLNRISQAWTAADNTLMSVPEASSSSERLAQEGKAESSKKRSQSAYGSLKSVISGGSGKRKAIDGDTFREQEATSSKPAEAQNQVPAWAVHASTSSSHPAITLAAPTASKHLSLDTSSAMQDNADTPINTFDTLPPTGVARRASSHQRGPSMRSLPASRLRAGTLGSLKSWLPWPRPSNLSHRSQQELTKAEDRLRDMLMSSQNLGKGKAAISVA